MAPREGDMQMIILVIRSWERLIIVLGTLQR
jgi:hypothetical protein